MMDQERFWDIIAEACQSDPSQSDEWGESLQTLLMKLPPGEIVAWNRIFDRLADRAYTVDLWGAAWIINGGASDDGFYYFRCWLICMGRDIYEAAIANPDTLADVVEPGMIAESEPYSAAHEAWMAVTGDSAPDSYQVPGEIAELQGEDWDFDDEEEASRRLPRLSALFRES